MEIINKMDEFLYSNREDLEEITFDNSITIIQAGAFYKCPNLRKIIIPDTITLVQQGAFASCPKLEVIQYSKNTVFEDHCFNNDPSIKYLIQGNCTARCFYFPVDRQYAITIKNEQLSQNNKCDIYEGRMANIHGFPGSPVDQLQLIEYFAVYNSGDQEYSWFNTIQSVAEQGCLFRASGQSLQQFFNMKFTHNTRINWEMFQIIVNVCVAGRPLWNILIQSIGYDVNGMPTVQEILDTLQDFWPFMYNRFKYIIDNQDKPVNLLGYDQLVSGKFFKQNFSQFLKQGKLVQIKK